MQRFVVRRHEDGFFYAYDTKTHRFHFKAFETQNGAQERVDRWEELIAEYGGGILRIRYKGSSSAENLEI
jgi:hypothetical protein